MSRRPRDRRVRRTKRRLKEALLELIAERGYEEITVHDLTERADVGRSTFYSHYDSKDDLLFAGFDEWLASLAGPPESAARRREGETTAAPPFRFSRPLLEHIRTQKRFFHATILGSSDPRIRRRTVEMLTVPVRIELERTWRAGGAPSRGGRRLSKPEREASVHAIVGAFLGLAAWWLEQGGRLGVEAVDRLFQETVAAGRMVGSGRTAGIRST